MSELPWKPMPCERCMQADGVSVQASKVIERRSKVALVLDVPMRECPACGNRWISWEIARRLDELATNMLRGDVEVATRHFEGSH